MSSQSRNTAFYFGTWGRDVMAAGPGDFLVLGLEGNNDLTSRWDDGYWSIGGLVGGGGNDVYRAYADVTQVMDSGGNDTLHVAGYHGDYKAGLLDGRDLVLVNHWTGQLVMVMDFTGAGRIETFIDVAGERLMAHQVQNLALREGLGNVSYAEFQALTGDYSVSSAEFYALREIDLMPARANWNQIFHDIASQGAVNNVTIANAIQTEAMSLLSPSARHYWEQLDYYGMLLSSEYHGIAQHLPVVVPPQSLLPLSLVEDMALLYQAALDRRPDIDGLNYFVGDLTAGQSLQDIASSFYLSAEFRDQFESFGNSQYVNQLYQNVLGRAADEAGLEYWLTDIEVHDRSHSDVLVSFAQSEENRANAADWLAGLHYSEYADMWVL